MKRGRPPRRRTPPRRTPPRPRRGQRYAGVEWDDWRTVRDLVVDRARGSCEANTPACLPGRHPGNHAHHVILRAQGGPDEAWNLLYVCAAAHHFIHANPAASYAAGWLRKGMTMEEGPG